jgi:hypothetical protein
MQNFFTPIAASFLFAAMTGCASTSVQLTGDRPAEGLCQVAGQNLIALVLWGTQWRADQKDVAQREAAAELGLSEYFAKSGCFSNTRLVRRTATSTFTLQAEREAAQAVDSSATRVLAVTVRELGPVLQVLSSAALVEGGTEVVLQVQSFELSSIGKAAEFVVHWKNGGPGVIKGVATLPQDMQAALAASLEARRQ